MIKNSQKLFSAALLIAAVCVGSSFAQNNSGRKSPKTSNSAQAVASPQASTVEDFDFPAGTLLTNAGWAAHSGAGTNPITITSPGLSYTGYASSNIGNAITLAASGEDVNHIFPVVSAGTVYVALMVNVQTAALDATNGDYFFHLGPDPIGTTFRGRVFVKADAGGMLAFGISKGGSNATPANLAFTGFTYAANTTHLIVLKYSVVAGATNDTIDMFVNPTLGGAEPAVTVTAPDTVATDINPATFAFRQGTAATGPVLRADGIRVATSWATLATRAPSVRGDFNGDGSTDFALQRNSGGSKQWWVQNSNNAGFTSAVHGLSTDLAIPADYDGDGKTDLAVWRPGAATAARFLILQSSNSTLRTEIFGQTGDNPGTVGDYDGDGKADVSVYRQGAQSVFYYRGSLNNPNGNVTFLPWGTTGDFPYSGDFDGDGKFDACIGRPAGAGGQVTFYIRRSSDLTAEFVPWGIQTDSFMPGDYDGDGRTDFCAVRVSGGAGNFYILERDGGGTGGNPIVFANATTDLLAPGDYDGDGRTDIAIWRPNADPAQTNFWVRASVSGAVSAFRWGLTGDDVVTDYMVAGGS